MAVVEGFLVARADGVLASVDGDGWNRVFGVEGGSAGNWVADMAYSDDLGIWVWATHELFFSSEDARSWDARTGLSPVSAWPPHAISAAPWGFVAAGLDRRVWTTTDGKSWVERSSAPGSAEIHAAAANGSLCALLAADGRVMTSTTGLSWTTRLDPHGLSSLTGGIAVSPSVWVVVGPAGAVWTSSDGLSYTKRSAPWSVPASVITWDALRNMFLVVDENGQVWGSIVGTVWVALSASPVTSPTGVAVTSSTGQGVLTGSTTVSFSSEFIWGASGGPYASRVVVGPVATRAPFTPTLVAPAEAAVVALDRVNRFSWGFVGPDIGDRQSGFELRYRGDGSGAWTTVTRETPNAWWDAPASTFLAGLFEWQVRVAGRWGDLSPWSASGFFTAVVSPEGPSIVTPIDGAVIGAGVEMVNWSSAAQDAYQIRRVGDDSGFPDLGSVLWDSGTVVSSSTRSRQVSFPVNNRFEHVQLRVRSAGLWSVWDSIRVQVSYTPPAVPSVEAHIFTVQGLQAGLRYVVEVPMVGPGEPAVVGLDVWRRVEGDTGDGIRVAAGLVVGEVFDDYAVASGVEYEVRAAAHGDNGTVSWSEWDERLIGVLAVSEGGVLGLEGR